MKNSVSAVIMAVVCATPAFAEDYFATRHIMRGEIIAAEDATTADGLGQAPEDWIGLEARRNYYKGHKILPASLRSPLLVKRNAIVQMEYNAGGLRIRTEGRALEEGGKGEFVRVMNLGSRQTVTARIADANYVEVGS